MTVSIRFSSLKGTVRNLRRARKLLGYSETSTELTAGSFVKLPLINQKELLWDSLFLTANLSIGRYHEISTHLTNDEKIVMYLLASKLWRSAVAVEIGSFLGASACFLALGLGRKGRLYCVDTWTNDAMDEPRRDTFTAFTRNVRHFRRAIIPLRGTSVAMANTFNNTIDLLFIDGDHSYRQCLNDWQSWNRFLGTGAVVAFHDSGWAEGVMKVMRECVSPIAKREVHMNNMYVAWL